MEARSEGVAREDWLKRAQQIPTGNREVVVNRGTVACGGTSVEYYTTQPSPAQWVAIAVAPEFAGLEGTTRMVVGTGGSEFAAVEALSERLLRLIPVETIHQPSDWFGD